MPSNDTFKKKIKDSLHKNENFFFFFYTKCLPIKGKGKMTTNKNMYYFNFLDTRQVRSWYLLGFFVFISYGIK